MKPILYASNETAFTSLGIGVLADAISCYVTEERNGAYELTMTYPVTGQFADDITPRSIILARPNYSDQYQPFRIYKIQKSMSGATITVNAEHISYDLSGYVTSPFVAGDIQAALSGLVSHCVTNDCPITLQSSRSTIANFTPDEPASIRAWMGGRQGSLLDVYGGEWHYDRFTATLENNRGTNNGARILYGKNLLTLEQEQECSNLYSHVYPFFRAEDGTIINGTLTQVAAVSYTRVLALDFTEEWANAEEPPTAAELTLRAVKYIAANNLSVPKVNLKLNFAQIQELPEQVDLCDMVTVYFEQFGVSAFAECVKATWDVLQDRYSSIELGDMKTSLPDTIANTQADVIDANKRINQQAESVVVVANAVETTQASLEVTDNAISSLVSQTTHIEETYIDEEGLANLLATYDYVHSTQFNETAENFDFAISELQSTVGSHTSSITQLETHITFDINGVTVSASDADIRGVFGPESLEFIDNDDNVLAWVSGADGLGASQLSLGDPETPGNRWRIFASDDGDHLRFTRHI